MTIPKKKRVLARIALIVAALLVLATAGFLLWASDYYRAEPEALAVLDEEGVADEGGCIALAPKDEPAECGLVFYPGAKVQAESYLPILDKLRDHGIECFLARMPLNMAIFDANAADPIIDAHPEIEAWYVGGHSMGGAMASSYASDNPERVDGLILMGAYLYGDYPAADTLTVYGSLNTSVEDNLDYDENVVEIEGGNHAQFGNYGAQNGDAEASIPQEEQQRQTVEAIVEFVKSRNAV